MAELLDHYQLSECDNTMPFKMLLLLPVFVRVGLIGRD
jgi:hypothetical protein